MDRDWLLERLRRGHQHNVDFAAFCGLLEGLGFRLIRTTGSHRHFAHPSLPEILTIQPLRRQAKPYQIRQLMRLIRRYNLSLEDRP